MRVLITRPREDAQSLAAVLGERGIEALVEPLLEIRLLSNAVVALDGVQAVLLTSANGARAFGGLCDRRDVPIFAVGEATARAARALGFSSVHSAGGDVGDLARLAAARLDPRAGALLHVAGTEIAGDLSGILGGQGFSVRRAMLYEACPVSALSKPAIAAIADGSLDAALFFSPRTASAFVNLARGADVAEKCATIDAICLSASVSKALEGLTWRSRRVADRPDQASLLACLQRSLKERG
ncbi:MAG: uroporphyrinogen-III synthase [Rhodospirillaceae bacterium]|nr:uroporphyrinogen-III synthase [Rhodospirillaceae bacterium]